MPLNSGGVGSNTTLSATFVMAQNAVIERGIFKYDSK